VGKVREIDRLRRRVRVGTPDPSVTPVSGMAAVTELAGRLGMIKLLDTAIGPIKARDRGFTGGELLVGLAMAQLAGENFLVGLNCRRADVAGQVLAPVAGLSSTTAAGLARRLTDVWTPPTSKFTDARNVVALNYQGQRCVRPHVAT
jgi:hypothetical protein